jgi:phage-related protein
VSERMALVYGGADLSEWCSVEVAERGCAAAEPSTREVPGRAGLAVTGGRLAPLEIRALLTLRASGRMSAEELSTARRRVAAALSRPVGAALRIGDEPGLEWCGVTVKSCGEWSTPEEGGTCEVVFLAHDPVAYGTDVTIVDTPAFTVGGSAPTWPRFRLVAAAGSAVSVAVGGLEVRVERTFMAGDVVEIDCEAMTVTVNGADACTEATLTSCFFRLEPGERELTVAGTSEFTAYFTERWL